MSGFEFDQVYLSFFISDSEHDSFSPPTAASMLLILWMSEVGYGREDM